MGSPTLPLSTFFNVSVVVSPAATPGPSFNQGLIVGSSTAIPAATRLRSYTSLAQMVADGFVTNSAEYLSVSLYFAQSPAPTVAWVGRQDLTSIAQVTAVSGNLGTGYVVGDILGVTQSSASGGTVKVTSVSAGAIAYETTTGTASSGSTALVVASATGLAVGQSVVGVGIAAGSTIAAITGTAVTLSIPTTAALSTTSLVFSGVVLLTPGTGYSIANGLATSGGTGTGAQIDITAIGDTPLQAVIACRVASTSWYACMFVGTASAAGIDADYEAIAGFIEAATPKSTFFCTTGEAAILNGTVPNLFSVLKAAGYRRTLGMYSTTQSGTFPNNIYASAAAMGIVMGLNNGSPGSYFSLAYKTLIGVGTEPLTSAETTAICGAADRSTVGLNGNALLSFASTYNLIVYGTMSGGTFFDQTLFLDMLASDILFSGVAYIVSQPAVPITPAGLNAMKSIVLAAAARSQTIGFIAPSGTWNGPNIGSGNSAIENGQAFPNGYAVYASPVGTLSVAQKAARIFPGITLALIEAESGQSFTVTVDVQQ